MNLPRGNDERLRCHTFGIHLKVTDARKSRRFYESLGLVPVFGFGDADFLSTLPEGCDSSPEQYPGVIYRIADTEYEIAEGHPAVKQEVFRERISSPKVSAMLRVDSLLPLLRNRNIQLAAPVRRYYWGTIEAVLRDPDGFVVVCISPDSEEEMSAVSELVSVETVNAPAD